MKTLSIRPQFCWSIIHGQKRIENRARKDGRMPAMCNPRGPLLLHASASVGTREQFDEDIRYIAERANGDRSVVDIAVSVMKRGRRLWEPRPELLRGGIVGKCEVTAAIGPKGDVSFLRPGLIDMRWHLPGHWGLILADVEAVPFVACKGKLGLWECEL
jgi:hypothetical protein